MDEIDDISHNVNRDYTFMKYYTGHNTFLHTYTVLHNAIKTCLKMWIHLVYTIAACYIFSCD